MNNHLLKSLLVAALSLSAAHLAADGDSTNKTFLMPRAQGVNLPMHATTFYDLVHRKTNKNNGSDFALTGFWQQSANGLEQGKYFLADGKSAIDVSPAGAGNATLSNSSVDLSLLVHNQADATAASADDVVLSLNPHQEVYGARLDWHQNLDCLFKGLFLNAWIPFVNVSNNPRINVTSNLDDRRSADTLRSFFAGNNVSDASNGNGQVPLSSGKISGRRSKSGVADIDLLLGYQFLHTNKYYAHLGIAVTIPTSDEATGEWLFEPMVGNGNHWALGTDFTAGARLWHDDSQSINANLTMKYRYLFQHRENRVLGLYGNAQVSNNRLVQYQLLGKDSAARNIPLVPAANVLNMGIDVTPGSQLDADLSLCYHRGGLSVDLGYNFYAREGESVTRRASLATGYGIANTAFDTRTPFDVTVASAGELTNDNIDTNAASTDAQFTNAIYGGTGYVFKNWDCPVMLGLGGKYEWTTNNNALEQWSLWIKAGIGF